METNNKQYNLQKEAAISALKDFKPASNKDVIYIIETILKCYEVVDVCNENGITKVHKPKDQPQEVQFLIEELQSFINELKQL